MVVNFNKRMKLVIVTEQSYARQTSRSIVSLRLEFLLDSILLESGIMKLRNIMCSSPLSPAAVIDSHLYIFYNKAILNLLFLYV